MEKEVRGENRKEQEEEEGGEKRKQEKMEKRKIGQTKEEMEEIPRPKLRSLLVIDRGESQGVKMLRKNGVGRECEEQS